MNGWCSGTIFVNPAVTCSCMSEQPIAEVISKPTIRSPRRQWKMAVPDADDQPFVGRGRFELIGDGGAAQGIGFSMAASPISFTARWLQGARTSCLPCGPWRSSPHKPSRRRAV